MNDLTKKESREIAGGHEGTAYKLGTMWMDSVLATWGFFASIAVGIGQGMEE